jgi:hypothetical protein
MVELAKSVGAEIKENQNCIVGELSAIPEVEYILYARRDSVNLVLTVINEFNAAVRHRIYERQRNVARRLATQELDFYVLARDNRNPPDFLPTDMETIYERRTNRGVA